MAVYKSKKITKDGRQYFFRIKYRDLFGQIHDYSSPKFKTKKEAEIEEARYKIKVNNKEAFVSNITIEQAYNEMIENKKNKVKKQTLIKDENLFKHFDKIKNKKINDINLYIYNECFLKNIPENLSICYKNKIIGHFKQIIEFSNKMHNTSDSILKFVENFKQVGALKKEMEFFEYSEYLEFDKVIDSFEYHTFFEILYFMGLRKGELQALNWTDIDFEKNTLRINKSLSKLRKEKYTISSPKTKNSIRTLPMPKRVAEDLKTMYNDAIKYKGFKQTWFIFGKTMPFPDATIHYKKNQYCSKTPSKKVIRVHDFRHSCASLLINQGASVALVSKYLGHADVSITLRIYTHMFKSELNGMVDLLNKL